MRISCRTVVLVLRLIRIWAQDWLFHQPRRIQGYVLLAFGTFSFARSVAKYLHASLSGDHLR